MYKQLRKVPGLQALSIVIIYILSNMDSGPTIWQALGRSIMVSKIVVGPYPWSFLSSRLNMRVLPHSQPPSTL